MTPPRPYTWEDIVHADARARLDRMERTLHTRRRKIETAIVWLGGIVLGWAAVSLDLQI